RVYMYGDGELQRLTQDDSWAATVLPQELGNDAAAIARHPMRNVLTNVLGVREQTQIHLAEFPLKGDEVLLLCSDGLHGSLEDVNIATIIKDGKDLQTTARTLIDAALDGGSRDNVSALLIKCPPISEASTRIAPIPPAEPA